MKNPKRLSTSKMEMNMCKEITVFENHRKSLIQQCERSELRLHFEWTKVNKTAKMAHFDEFLKT